MTTGAMSALSHLVSLVMLALVAACATDGSERNASDTPRQREAASRADQTEAQKRAAIRLQLAMGYFEQRQLEVALDEIRQALSAEPNYADAYSVRALIYTEMGENSLAQQSFDRALQLSPNNPDYLNNYGWFLCQNGQEARAMTNFEGALQNRAYQSPGKALTNAGVCSLKQNDITGAERYLLQAFQYEAGNLIVNFSLAKIYHQRANYERAKFYTNRVVRMNGANAEMFWLAIKVERLLGDHAAQDSLVTQLRRRFPNSPEFAAYQRGAFNE